MLTVSSGSEFSIAVKADGTMKQWGNDSEGQRNGFPDGVKVNGVSCGNIHAVAIQEDGTLVQWGNEKLNQKNGFPVGLKAKSIACGQSHSVAIKEDGTLAQWGNTTSFQLEYETSKRKPRKSKAFSEVSGLKFSAVACGGSHSVGILEDGAIVQWGNEMNDQMKNFPTGTKVKAVACGYYFSVAIQDDGTLVQWGEDYFQKKDFPIGVKVKAIACGSNHSVAIKEDGTLVQWGEDRNKQRVGLPKLKFKAIAAGKYHSVGITEDGNVVQWGNDGGNVRKDIPGEAPAANLNPLQRLERSQGSEILGDSIRYPKYENKLPFVPLKTEVTNYTLETTAFDPVMQTDVTLDEALKDADKPLIVKTGDTYSLVDRGYISGSIGDLSGIRYACNQDEVAIVTPNILYRQNPFFLLKGLSSTPTLVLLSEMEHVLKNNIQSIKLVPTPDKFTTLATGDFVYDSGTGKNFAGKDFTQEDAYGADHCQAGTDKTLHSIVVLQLTSGSVGVKRMREEEPRRSTRTRKGGKRKTYRKKNQRKNRKTFKRVHK
jgi:hypothetical protein